MYLSLYKLTFKEGRKLKLLDPYSCHRVVYDLFPRLEEKERNRTVLYADKGVKNRLRELLILSTRKPETPEAGQLCTKALPEAYLKFPAYRFEIVINPVRRLNQTRRLVPVRGRDDIAEWFLARSPAWGFNVAPASLQVGKIWVDQFSRKGMGITLGKADVQGCLQVADFDKFLQSARYGIGRGKAFGCGLLQIVPANCSENF